MRKIRLKRKQGGLGRPFPKGASGNPRGRPAKPPEQRAVEADVRRYSRGFGREAVDRLVELMRGKAEINVGTPEKPKIVAVPVAAATQLSAAEAILDRGYGRPHQSVEMTGKDGDPIEHQEVSAFEVIESRLAAIRERLLEEGRPLLTQP